MDVRGKPQPAAVFEKVTKVYRVGWGSRRITALDQVSLTVPAGEVFGLIGPNRSGKTTLVKVLLSICRATDGRVMRLGRPWSERGTLARVGYVHENPSFPRYLTARQLVEGYGRLSGIGTRQARLRRRGAARTRGTGRPQSRSHRRIQQGHVAAVGTGAGLGQ